MCRIIPSIFLKRYLKLGYTHYNPGMIWDKDFTEFATWYFKHKIYKKKYWNLDAYLYR